jgi:hypothetical protein
MSDHNVPNIASLPTTEAVESFNNKVAEMLKQASNAELVEILRSPNSVVTPLHNNVNNN